MRTPQGERASRAFFELGLGARGQRCSSRRHRGRAPWRHQLPGPRAAQCAGNGGRRLSVRIGAPTAPRRPLRWRLPLLSLRCARPRLGEPTRAPPQLGASVLRRDFPATFRSSPCDVPARGWERQRGRHLSSEPPPCGETSPPPPASCRLASRTPPAPRSWRGASPLSPPATRRAPAARGPAAPLAPPWRRAAGAARATRGGRAASAARPRPGPRARASCAPRGGRKRPRASTCNASIATTSAAAARRATGPPTAAEPATRARPLPGQTMPRAPQAWPTPLRRHKSGRAALHKAPRTRPWPRPPLGPEAASAADPPAERGGKAYPPKGEAPRTEC